jgi:hypothetical protein
MKHGEGSAFPELTLTHFHSDACCGLVNGKPELICKREPNACTTCVATGKSKEEMQKCVASRVTR